MAENITRCPKCKTSFRISDAHLKSAKGAVRCGSCLNIFNAKEHLINAKKETAETNTAKPETIKTEAKAHQPKTTAKAQTVKAQATTANKKATRSDTQPSIKAASSFAKALATKTEKTAPTKSTPKPDSANSIAPPHKDDDDILISDDMDNRGGSKYDESFNTEEFDDNSVGHSSTGQYDVNLFERDMDDNGDDDAADSDESWALDLLNEDNDPPPPAPTQEELDREEERKITQEFEASFNFTLVDDPTEDSKESQESFNFDDYPESEDSGFATGEFDAVDSFSEDKSGTDDFDEDYTIDDEDFDNEDFDEGYDAGYTSDKTSSDSKHYTAEDEAYGAGFDENYEEDYEDEYNVLKEDENELEEDYQDTAHTIKEAYFAEEDDIASEPFERESANYLDAIEPEPVEFSFKRHSNFWQSNILWGTFSAVAAVALFVQIAMAKFDTLSLVEPYRSYYGVACQYVDCTLPELVNRNKIRTANLVVRSHPKTKNALIVDAVLQNTAKFEQSFPILDLVFTDSREKPVAARRLTPEEYLRGELAGRTTMPVKQPVHIAIEISDPGPEAVGYRISIVD